MAPITIEATIENGHIIPDDPGKIPANGRVLVTVEDAQRLRKKPDVNVIQNLLSKTRGTRVPMSGVEYERQVRAEWDER